MTSAGFMISLVACSKHAHGNSFGPGVRACRQSTFAHPIFPTYGRCSPTGTSLYVSFTGDSLGTLPSPTSCCCITGREIVDKVYLHSPLTVVEVVLPMAILGYAQFMQDTCMLQSYCTVFTP